MIDVGAVVVWPHHGPVRAEAIEDREVGGKTVSYVVLSPVHGGRGDLALVVPADKLETSGAREICDPKTAKALLKTLSDGPTPISDKGWSAKFKAMTERSHTGELEAHAENLRDMAIRHAAKELSPAEKRLWDQTLTRLSVEIAVSCGRDVEDVERDVLDQLAVEEPVSV